MFPLHQFVKNTNCRLAASRYARTSMLASFAMLRVFQSIDIFLKWGNGGKYDELLPFNAIFGCSIMSRSRTLYTCQYSTGDAHSLFFGGAQKQQSSTWRGEIPLLPRLSRNSSVRDD